jgi:hypothetical protein
MLRSLSLVLAVTITVNGTGCHVFQRFRGNNIQAPIVFETFPTREQVIAQLAEQSQRIQQLQTDVRVSIDGVPPLRGTLAVERPRRLRLKAGLMGVSEMGIDVGSNDELFWIWSKAAMPGQEPAIYFCRHHKFQYSELGQAMPIDPKWLIDSLGLVEFGPGDRIEGPIQRSDGRLEIHAFQERTASMATRRVLVIDPRYGFINQQAIYDSSGRLIAYSNAVKHQLYPEHNVSLPGQIVLKVQQVNATPFTVVVDTGPYRINSIFGDAEMLWSLPRRGDVPLIDLSEMPASVNSDQTSQSSDIYPSRQYGHRVSATEPNRGVEAFSRLR